MGGAPGEGTVSEQMAARVLKRATELEAAHEGRIGIEELRAAALEAGIPLDAFERALAEARAGTTPTTAVASPSSTEAASRGLVRWARRFSLFATGVGIAAGSAALTIFDIDMDAAAVFSIILAAFTVVGMLWTRRADRSITGFLRDLAPLWIGFTMAWMLVVPSEAGEVLQVSSLLGAIAAFAGSFGLAVPTLFTTSDELQEPPPRPLLDR